MSRSLARATLLLVLVAACGDDDGATTTADAAVVTPDAPPPAIDASPADAAGLNTAACPATYGPAGITNTLAVASTADQAFDLDGDGDKDNSLSIIASLVNGNISDDLADGTLRLVTELRDLDDATLTTDAALRLVLFVGLDGDLPAAPGDDFSHSEAFYYRHASVDPVTCEPSAVMDVALAAGVITGSEDSVTIPISGIGLVDLGKPKISLSVVPDASGTGLEATGGLLGGAIPPCPLQNSTGPLGMNNLHAVRLVGLQPDIDLDGDGLETIQNDTNGILSCTDGDATVIPGDACGCDPRMVDGFSVLLQFTDVGASILGPSPTP